MRQKIDLNDYKFNVGNLLLDQEVGFNTRISNQRILPYENTMHNSVTYEISMTRNRYLRTVYSFLDFLRDLGGLFSSLTPLCGVLVSILQYRGSYMYIASQMLSDKVDVVDDMSKTQMYVTKAVDEDMKKQKKVRWNCFNVFCFNLKFRIPHHYI